MSFGFLELEFLDNTVSDYLIALATLLLGAIVIKIVLNLILNRLKRWARKTATSLDNAIIRIFESNLIPIFYLGIFNLAVSNLTLNPILKQAIDPLTIILATILGIRFCVALAEYFLLLYSVTHNENNPNLKQSLNALIPAIKVLIWAVGIVFILDNLGFDISAVVASLGIGGVAIALASQGVLKDLFSYFSILFDRPFEIGDFIVVGDFLGTVEQVGIKTTRLKSIGGEELILANTDLTDSRIRNFKKMQQRRIVFKISVAYTTSLEALQEIPDLIENIVKETENVIFDRVHFNSYGDFSLDFETVYFVATSDYKDYMDAQQQINLRIKQEFEKRAIEFAYTTRVWQKLMQSESLN